MIYELLIGLLITSLIMFFTWLVYLKNKNPGIVDVSWGLSITACGLWYLFNQDISNKSLICGALLLFWGIRLSGFLFYTRVLPKHVEKRYFDMMESWNTKQDLKFLMNFMIQALFGFIIATPFIFINNNTELSVIDYIAACFVIIGIIGEWLSDFQLYKYKKEAKGILCDIGLWHHSRHPNYFFEIIAWAGFSIFAWNENSGAISLISPLLLTYIMVFITGPITETHSIKSRGEIYLNYQKSTSMIIPWFKKKN